MYVASNRGLGGGWKLMEDIINHIIIMAPNSLIRRGSFTVSL